MVSWDEINENSAIFAGMLIFVSLWLIIAFPSFIRESVCLVKTQMIRLVKADEVQRRQGANPEVIGRLQYFKEVNSIRTLFRFIYVVAILTLAVDGFTDHKIINRSPSVSLFP